MHSPVLTVPARKVDLSAIAPRLQTLGDAKGNASTPTLAKQQEAATHSRQENAKPVELSILSRRRRVVCVQCIGCGGYLPLEARFCLYCGKAQTPEA